MILEAIVTTTDSDGKLNIAPMGPLFEPGDEQFELRPFETSQTYHNLTANPFGVLHITDDVGLFASSAINQLQVAPKSQPAVKGTGFVLPDCCRWMEFTATEIRSDSHRKNFHCHIVAQGTGRPFYGFNRAKHAVLEATILATRIDFIPTEEIKTQFERCKTIVEKTGGPNEQAAFELLTQFVDAH